uniref:Uncharacterized protein n=1 Tax=viral metagenome TaxID=1070528 RepID=A0A6H1ZSH2_9ZZZZ
MRVKIDEMGILVLERKGGETVQMCPVSQWYDDERECYENTPCGDHCPQFSEPVRVDGGLSVSLSLCHGKEIRCLEAEFIDERIPEDEAMPASPHGGAKCLQS